MMIDNPKICLQEPFYAVSADNKKSPQMNYPTLWGQFIRVVFPLPCSWGRIEP